MSSSVGKKIRNIRESLNMGRAEFCEKTGIKKGTLIGIEQERSNPSGTVILAVAQAFPEFSIYLITNESTVKQRNPEVELAAREPEKA